MLVLHVLALMSVLIAGIHFAAKALLVLIIIINLVTQARRYLFLTHKNSLTRLKLADNGIIRVSKANSLEWQPAELKSSVIWPWILMFRLTALSADAQTFNLLIARDAVSREAFRKISQWAGQPSPAETHKNQIQQD